jgi:glycosyltransferase involved in cell wall biosynthesis
MSEPTQPAQGPLVTIWTPCYNHEPYLDDYFAGLLAQTYTNVQLILIDDGSTDGSWAKVCSYEARLRAKFPHVVLERHQNIGATEEFLAHFWKHAAGELMCILESDDYYLPTMLEECVRYLTAHPEVGAVHSEIDYVYPDHIEQRHWAATGVRVPEGDIFEALLLRGNFIMTCAFCCRTELLREHIDWRAYLVKGYVARDYAWFLDLARHTRIGYIDKALVRYRVLPNSTVHATDLARRYRLFQNYYQIRTDYIERYGGPAGARNAVLRDLHLAHVEFGYQLHLPAQFWQGHNWLIQNSPDDARATRLRLRALAMRHRLLWRLLHTAEVSALLPAYHAVRRLGRARTDARRRVDVLTGGGRRRK